MRDFELNELHLQCKKTPLTKHRDRKDAANSVANAGDATVDAGPAAEADEDLSDNVDTAVKKTQ